MNAETKVGLYIRLSKKNNKKYEQNSESVINQRKILNEYCKSNNLTNIKEYIDDGYSGTTFDRPGFNKMINDIKQKRINLVIVKDLSRLGRDHILTGYYMETFFPENKVRFISIVENYDSFKNQASNDSSTFIIAFNDYYSKQNSLKIRNVLDTKRKAGKFIGSRPSYGYMKDPKDKGHLIPDPKVYKYVQAIFNLKSEGKSSYDIKNYLTNICAPTPQSYKNSLNNNKWTSQMVNRILKNRMYIGDMVQHTQTNISYKSKKRIFLDKNQWIIVKNTHKPLVDKNIFFTINNNSKTRVYLKRKRNQRLLEGLLYCYDCGKRLSISYRKKQDYWSINCCNYLKDPSKKYCKSHFFPYNYLEDFILKNIKDYLTPIFKKLDIYELNDYIKTKINSKLDYTYEIKKLLDLNKSSRSLLFSLIERIEVSSDRNIIVLFKYNVLNSFTFKYTNNS